VIRRELRNPNRSWRVDENDVKVETSGPTCIVAGRQSEGGQMKRPMLVIVALVLEASFTSSQFNQALPGHSSQLPKRLRDAETRFSPAKSTAATLGPFSDKAPHPKRCHGNHEHDTTNPSQDEPHQPIRSRDVDDAFP
jgi:hypothetical protein